MKKAMKERGDDEYTVILGAVADMMRKQNLAANKGQQNATPQMDLADLLDGTKLKRMMAKQFEDADEDGGLGKTINQVLIQDRNKACMKVLQQQIAAGKKKIAIFYGAAHMPDFDKRLKDDFGMKRKSDDWFKAWSLKKDGPDIGDVLKKLLED